MAAHMPYLCPGTGERCLENRCVYCAGGLVLCTVCRAAESELPSECPGRPMTEEERNEVSAGRLDYRRGTWLGPFMMDLPT